MLNVGLQLQVISPTVFAMLVIMTLVSTVATAPALSVIDRYGRAGAEPAGSPAAGTPADPPPTTDSSQMDRTGRNP